MKVMTISSKEVFEKAVDEVIHSSKYMHLQEKESIWEKIVEKILHLLDKGLEKGYPHSHMNSQGSQSFFIIIAFIFIGILIYYTFSSKQDKDLNKKEIYGEEIDERTTYESLCEKAQNFEKNNNYKEAIRYYFISILILMNEKSLCFLDDTKTNDEIITELKIKKFKEVRLFKNIGDYFYYIWYGDKPVVKERYMNYKETVNDLFLEVYNYHEE
ncbi:hypothetical protein [Inediibacterium massiliense]|uniref:hypothetical protein n=1 Tax=Inediibacterium massiliense TaxID=1658111 RepID=UPI0006B6705E|nr:hypothetical protein [Inediibacterium massiliense]